MTYKISHHEYTGGQPPLGWMLDPTEHPDAKPRHLVPRPEEQGILRIIAKLHQDGWSNRRIALHLGSIGIENPRQVGGGQEGKAGWSHVTIGRLLKKMDRLLADD
jgi:hypothetical protein